MACVPHHTLGLAGGVICDCPDELGGAECEIPRGCDDGRSPCQHSSVCNHTLANGITCVCDVPYFGDVCQHIVPAAPAPTVAVRVEGGVANVDIAWLHDGTATSYVAWVRTAVFVASQRVEVGMGSLNGTQVFVTVADVTPEAVVASLTVTVSATFTSSPYIELAGGQPFTVTSKPVFFDYEPEFPSTRFALHISESVFGTSLYQAQVSVLPVMPAWQLQGTFTLRRAVDNSTVDEWVGAVSDASQALLLATTLGSFRIDVVLRLPGSGSVVGALSSVAGAAAIVPPAFSCAAAFTGRGGVLRVAVPPAGLSGLAAVLGTAFYVVRVTGDNGWATTLFATAHGGVVDVEVREYQTGVSVAVTVSCELHFSPEHPPVRASNVTIVLAPRPPELLSAAVVKAEGAGLGMAVGDAVHLRFSDPACFMVLANGTQSPSVSSADTGKVVLFECGGCEWSGVWSDERDVLALTLVSVGAESILPVVGDSSVVIPIEADLAAFSLPQTAGLTPDGLLMGIASVAHEVPLSPSVTSRVFVEAQSSVFTAKQGDVVLVSSTTASIQLDPATLISDDRYRLTASATGGVVGFEQGAPLARHATTSGLLGVAVDALHTLVFSPHRHAVSGAVVVTLSESVSGDVIGASQRTVLVEEVNEPPTITASASALSVAFDPVESGGMLHSIAVTDPDDASRPSQVLRLTITVPPEYRVVANGSIVGIEYQSSSASALSMAGTTTALSAAVRRVAVLGPLVRANAAATVPVAMVVSDMEMSVNMVLPITFRCPGALASGAATAAATIINAGARLVVTVSPAWAVASRSGPVACELVLAHNGWLSCQTPGVRASRFYFQHGHIVVDLAPALQLALPTNETVLRLAPLFPREGCAPVLVGDVPVTVASREPPSLSLAGPRLVGACTDAVVVGTLAGPEPRPVRWVWDCDDSESRLLVGLDVTSSTMRIPSGRIAAGASYTVIARVKTWVCGVCVCCAHVARPCFADALAVCRVQDGAVTSTVFNFSKSSALVPAVHIAGGPTQTWTGSLRLLASASPSSCNHDGSPEVVFDWAVSPMPEGGLPPGSRADSSVFHLAAPSVGVFGRTFEVTVVARVMDEPTLASSPVSITLHAREPSLVAELAGGSSVAVPVSSPIQLDATGSFDPLGNSVSVAWSCATLSGGSCGTDPVAASAAIARGDAPIPLLPLPSVLRPPEFMLPRGTYVFTVAVRQGVRLETATQVVHVLDDGVPHLSVAPTRRELPRTTSTVVVPLSFDAGAEVQWNVAGAAAAVASRLVPDGLLLNEAGADVWRGGHDVRVEVSARNTVGVSIGEAVFTVNSAPVRGLLVVTPQAGVVANTSFTAVASQFADAYVVVFRWYAHGVNTITP
mgnify:CR=1 FL=1